ncbi:hydratase [Bradyrhizobium sp. AUGA SZCCT0222]|uniref:2-keto-4-pentenoate hydratase n=1 Tax=Bradyrhizobium sp. AUGA SZCCT0222 TaxID=2807668 RepID=UPI001BA55B7C|nr:hydratase [Bradyrhizobium sp. AUGA SZCCT0222]MBR1267141.1 hydratase [Bradyrhizobium sp. AUGA SZCCT0222]
MIVNDMALSTRQQALADLLTEARRNGRQLETLADDLVPETAAGAYQVNRVVAEQLGWPTLGWKIAGTTNAVRGKLGLDGPIYGRTFRRFECRSPARFKAAELLDPLVECEFFVTLARDLPPRREPWTLPEVTDAIAEVHAGIEVAECRYRRGALPPLPAILADGSASGRYVFGDRIENWCDGLASMRVRLEVDGAMRREGSGGDVMGDPLAPLLWLAEERRHWGDGLRAGETISTGSMTGMLPVRAGQSVRARFDDAATVEIAFE